MIFRNILTTVALLCLMGFGAAAQQRRGRAPQRPAQTNVPAAATPSPAATPLSAAIRPAPPDPQTIVLATLNNQKITLADLDSEVRDLVLKLDQDIADVRRSELDKEINQILFENEAKRRHVTVSQLLGTEVDDRVIGPTEDELRVAYNENRAQIGGADYASVRPALINFIRGQRAQKLTKEFADRLKAASPVTPGADPNAPNLSPGAVLATVAGRTITAAEFNERVAPIIYELRMKAFDAEKGALDILINNTLISAEAQKRGVQSDEVMRQEVTNKITPPSDADIRKFYEENKARLTGDLETYRSDISAFLQQEQQERLEHDLAQRRRTAVGPNLRVMLTEPESPVQKISVDDDPARGDANSPVTVVEFTDFQCPACGRIYPILEDALKPYGSRVRFVIRDFPLDQHENARKAAEAADAANAQ